MNEVYCLDNTTGREFTLYFDDLKKQRNFLIKCRYSKKIHIIGFTYQSYTQYQYLTFGR